MPHFKLPKERAEKGDVIIGQYAFVDGKMPVSVHDAALLEPILCRFHGCTLVNDDAKSADAPDAVASQSLKASVTKTEATTVAKTATDAK